MQSLDVASILKRAAEQGGFIRTRYIEKNIPTSISDITVMMFFGDMRSLFVLSSILLKRYREEMKGSKYFILCTWPGYEFLFPYVDEYWVLRDSGILNRFMEDAGGFVNTSHYFGIYQRNLNHFFEEVLEPNVLLPYYDNGLTQEFFDRFKHVKVTLPSVPSAAILGAKFNKDLAKRHGYKVFLYPAIYVQHWAHGKIQHLKSMKDFWVQFAKKLASEGFVPVAYRSQWTHDLSTELPDQCIYLEEPDMFKVLGAMRAVDCTIDVFTSISRLAIAARSPFIQYDERTRHAGIKEYEIDGLCCAETLPREYIYGFPTIIENGNLPLWDNSLFANIINRLSKFLPDLDRDKWPTPSEGTEIVPYDSVRKKKLQRFGTRFVKVERD